ncbi:MAG: hypothetical protein KC492_34335, partial [Myxococcales bacterium]|nr:hypothetical protein [Myxococcales bacterium]
MTSSSRTESSSAKRGEFSRPRPRPSKGPSGEKKRPKSRPGTRAPVAEPLVPLGGRLMYIVFGLAILLILVLPGSCVGDKVADIAYEGVRKVFEANPPQSNR